MKKNLCALLIVAATAIIAASIFCAIKSNRQTQAERQKALTAQAEHEKVVKELNQKIERLEQNAVALERQLLELRERADKNLGLPTISSNPKTKPPAGTPFEFNGRTYYFTPLGENPQASFSIGK